MRVDIRLRDDVWWFCEQVGRKVDFKVGTPTPTCFPF